MSLKFSLDVIDSNSEIYTAILKALLPEVKDFINTAFTQIKTSLPPIVRSAIIDTPEYRSLLDGQLKYEFGIPDSGSKLAGLLDIWSNNLNETYNSPSIQNNQIKASFSVSMIRIDFADVLYTDYAYMQDSIRGYNLPWLEWLLLEGNRTIISDYQVLVGPNKASRTGMAIMSPSRKSWRVPSSYAGTENDNWITRALDSIGPQIQQIINAALKL